jgi:hypothetical protein
VRLQGTAKERISLCGDFGLMSQSPDGSAAEPVKNFEVLNIEDGLNPELKTKREGFL